MLRNIALARTSLLTLLFVCFLVGLAAARLSLAAFMSSWAVLVTGGVLALLMRAKNAAVVAVVCVGLFTGYWRGTQFLLATKPLSDLNGRTITAVVQVSSDGVYGDHTQLVFDADHLDLQYPYQARLPGSLQIAGFGEVAVYKGDLVEAEGRVKLAKGSKQLRMDFADLRVVGRSSSALDAMRRRFAAGMQSALPEPHASFAMGLLIGQKSTLPQDFALMLSAVGLTHIIAVSGYNLTIIADTSRKVLKKGSKYQIMVCSVVLILLFVSVTGFSASIVRAALVSLLSLCAWYYGRQFKPLLLISLTAAVTAGWNPFYLWSDIGWYLSFLAFFGVMVLGPLVNQRVFHTNSPNAIKALLSESVCAMIMTMPFILFIFKQVSIIALPANILVVPFVPLAMLLTLFAGLAGMVAPSLAGWIAWPAKALLTYMLDIVTYMSRVPHILVQRQLGVIGMMVLYATISVLMIILWRKQPKTGIITEIKRSTLP